MLSSDLLDVGDEVESQQRYVAQVTVILKHVFSPAELEEEPTMKTDLEADMASECAKLGPVDKVYLLPPISFAVLSCPVPTSLPYKLVHMHPCKPHLPRVA